MEPERTIERFGTDAGETFECMNTGDKRLLLTALEDSCSQTVSDPIDMRAEMTQVSDPDFDVVRARLRMCPTAAGDDPTAWRLLDIIRP